MPMVAVCIFSITYASAQESSSGFNDVRMLKALNPNFKFNQRDPSSFTPSDEKFLTEYIEHFNDYLFLLLAKNQYLFLYNYFTNPKAEALNLKEQLKPIWYALMYYMQDEYPNEYLRMGEELEETV